MKRLNETPVESLGALRYLATIHIDDPMLRYRFYQHIEALREYLYPTNICPTCKKEITDPVDRDFLDIHGECLGCDHVRGEMNHELYGFDGEVNEDGEGGDR
jgi:hypothetical protein